jgi:hypothetical protein
MPGKPEIQTAQVPKAWYPEATASMLTATAYMYLDRIDLLTYGIAFWDCPEAALKNKEELLDRIFQHIMSNKQVDWYGDISLGQYPGREFQGSFSAEGMTAKGQGRIYFAKGRILVLTVMGQEATSSHKNKIDKFMNSLRILQ